MTTSNRTPAETEQALTVSWNRQNTSLEANEIVNATITLTVSPQVSNSISTFGFAITITATA
jgi:hypothetical protein